MSQLLRAFAVGTDIILGHVAIMVKSNEIPAMQALVREIGLAGVVGTADAMQCQINTGILLRETSRHEGKVRKRTLCTLSGWAPAHVEGLRGVLKGGTVIPPGQDAFTVSRSLPHGHVAAVLGTARKIGL